MLIKIFRLIKKYAEALDKIYMEHGGGGNSFESYTAASYRIFSLSVGGGVVGGGGSVQAVIRNTHGKIKKIAIIIHKSLIKISPLLYINLIHALKSVSNTYL